jgi:hypothetical protein
MGGELAAGYCFFFVVVLFFSLYFLVLISESGTFSIYINNIISLPPYLSCLKMGDTR